MKKPIIYLIASLVALTAIIIAGISVYGSGEQIVSNTLSISGTVILTPSPDTSSGGAGGAYSTDGKTYLFDSITSSCKVLANVEADSHDGKASVDIPYGTIAKDKNGKALRFVQIEPLATVPTLPEGSNVVGIPYEYSPSGATFDPAVTITFKYDPAKVPNGADLQLVFWNGSEWIQLTDVVVDPITGTVSGKTTHFTPFAVLAVPKPKPPVVTPTPAPAPEPVVTPEPTVPPVTEPTPTKPEIKPEPVKPIPVTPAPTPQPAPPTKPLPTPEPEKGYGSWIILGIIIVLVIVIVVFVLLLNRRKRSKKQGK